MFQLENLETIRSKFEGMSRGFLNWHKIVPRTCRWEIRHQIFQNCPMPPPSGWKHRPVSMHHSLVPFGTPRAIPWKRCLDLKNCWLRQFWMNIVPWNCQVLSFNSHRILHVRPYGYEPWIISSCTFCKVYYRSYNFKWKIWTRTSSNIWSGSVISGKP